MAERCPMCDRLSDEECSCGALAATEPGEMYASPAEHAVAKQLVRAWLSVGVGGLIGFAAYTVLILHHYAAAGCVALVAGALIARGARVASKPRELLLALASRGALPPARLVP